MDCPGEQAQVRRALQARADIAALHFDLAARTLAIRAPAPAWDDIERAIAATGLRTRRMAQAPDSAQTQARQRREALKLAAALALAALTEALAQLGPDTPAWRALGMATAASAIALAGLGVYRKGLGALRRAQLGIATLMAVAVSGAFLIGEWAEAAMVMSLFSLAELIEARAAQRARHAIGALLALTPPEAEVLQPDGRWATQPVAAIVPGSVLRIRPGQRLPLDGRITAGHSAVDQSPITGESTPVDKTVGDEVFAGSVNRHGLLQVQATAAARDTVLARIIEAVEQAQNTRAPTQRLVDRFAAIYTPAVFAAALAVALLGPLLAGWAWGAALYKALVLLVIACPCALVISTPVAIVSGLAAAAGRGILIKGGAYLEQAHALTWLALDKTGTLTEGRPRLIAHTPLRPGPTPAHLWASAAALAAQSEHPVARAIAAGLAGPAVTPDAAAVHDFSAHPGLGVQGHVRSANRPEPPTLLHLGNRRWMQQLGLIADDDTDLHQRLAAHEQQGHSLSLLADAQGPLALFAVADTLKPHARDAVHALHALGVQTLMLTGDHPATAQAIAAQAGVAHVQAGLLPQDKLAAIQALAATPGQRVGMVGDGINDAPALAAAHIGIAMGRGGTHIAAEAADIVLMTDELRRLPELIRLSRRTRRLLWQNITLALGIKAAFLLLALAGHASMWMAVFADMGASLLVVFNGLRLLRSPRGQCG